MKGVLKTAWGVLTNNLVVVGFLGFLVLGCGVGAGFGVSQEIDDFSLKLIFPAASIVFAIAGVWVSILFPQFYRKTKGGEVLTDEERGIFRGLTAALKLSSLTLIAAIIWALVGETMNIKWDDIPEVWGGAFFGGQVVFFMSIIVSILLAVFPLSKFVENIPRFEKGNKTADELKDRRDKSPFDD